MGAAALLAGNSICTGACCGGGVNCWAVHSCVACMWHGRSGWLKIGLVAPTRFHVCGCVSTATVHGCLRRAAAGYEWLTHSEIQQAAAT